MQERLPAVLRVVFRQKALKTLARLLSSDIFASEDVLETIAMKGRSSGSRIFRYSGSFPKL
jgi:hypothetical protein